MKNLLIIRESIWWPHLTFAEVEFCSSQRVRTDVMHSLSSFRRELVFCIAGEYSSHTHIHTHTLSLSLSLSVAVTQRDSTRVPIRYFQDLFNIRLYQGWRTYGTFAQNVTRRDFFGTRHSLLTHFLFLLPDQCLCIVKIIWLRTDSIRCTAVTN
jgi:hypothetical protein